jgi:hypothetical protein
MMMKILRILFTVVLTLIITNTGAQMTSSPYSMFGAGKVEDNGFGVSRAMGNTGIGFKSTNYLNNINPASYSGIDSLSFLFEVGLFGGYTRLKSQHHIQDQFDGNIRYLALGFRAAKWWTLSLGIVPYSSVGYMIRSTGNIEGEVTTYSRTYTGEGGLNQFYITNAISPIKNLSLGVNFSYIFGSFTQKESMTSDGSFKGYLISKTNYVHNVYLDYGLQYTLQPGKVGYTLGLIYGSKRNLKTSTDYHLSYANDTIELKGEAGDFLVPAKYGIGIGIEMRNKFNIGVDYERRDWSKLKLSDPLVDIRNSERFSAGFAYLPYKSYRDEWYKKIFYRLGADYEKSYLIINGIPINSKSISFGVGIPLRNEYSMINISLEAGQKGSTSKGLILENFYLIHVNLNLHDIWFLKPKYD